MTVIKAEDMHCEKCEERITEAMKLADLDFEVNLEDRTITIDGCTVCVKTALKILDDLGFDAVVMK